MPQEEHRDDETQLGNCDRRRSGHHDGWAADGELSSQDGRGHGASDASSSSRTIARAPTAPAALSARASASVTSSCCRAPCLRRVRPRRSPSSGDYRLTGKLEDDMIRQVGRKVEVVGKVKNDETAVPQTGKASDLPSLDVEVWHTFDDFCPAQPDAAPISSVASAGSTWRARHATCRVSLLLSVPAHLHDAACGGEPRRRHRPPAPPQSRGRASLPDRSRWAACQAIHAAASMNTHVIRSRSANPSRLMITEVTVEMYRVAGLPLGEQPPWSTSPRHPVVIVTWDRAQQFCGSGRRPTADGGRVGVRRPRGREGSIYPWGDQPPTDRRRRRQRGGIRTRAAASSEIVRAQRLRAVRRGWQCLGVDGRCHRALLR